MTESSPGGVYGGGQSVVEAVTEVGERGGGDESKPEVVGVTSDISVGGFVI